MNTNFNRLLSQSGMTIYKLSKRSGLPYTVVHEIASGKKDINRRPAETVARLAVALGADFYDLLEPIHFMDKVRGKYKGVSYEWHLDTTMRLSTQAKTLSQEINTPYHMTNPRDRKAYDAYTELCIDQAMQKQETDRKIADFLETIGATSDIGSVNPSSIEAETETLNGSEIPTEENSDDGYLQINA